MTFFRAALVIAVLLIAAPVQAATPNLPSLPLEEKISYQQGQFGALYAHCGSGDEQEVIGGNLATWRMETFRGYNGTPAEHVAVEKAFDTGAAEVYADANSCTNWVKQAAAAWHSIVYLAQYGLPVPVASN